MEREMTEEEEEQLQHITAHITSIYIYLCTPPTGKGENKKKREENRV